MRWSSAILIVCAGISAVDGLIHPQQLIGQRLSCKGGFSSGRSIAPGLLNARLRVGCDDGPRRFVLRDAGCLGEMRGGGDMRFGGRCNSRFEGDAARARRKLMPRCEDSMAQRSSSGPAGPFGLAGGIARYPFFRLALATLGLMCVFLPGPVSAAGGGGPAAAAQPLDTTRRVLGLLLATGAFGAWAEDNTRVGAAISGAMVTFFAAMVLSSFGWIPTSSDHAVYQVVWNHLVPMAVCQMMLRLDRLEVVSSFRRSGSMLRAFSIASLGTFLGCITAYISIPIENASKLASVFCATYIGGTLNFIATADAVGLRDPAVIASGFSADMIMMAAYFSGLFFLARRVGAEDGAESGVVKVGDAEGMSAVTAPAIVSSESTIPAAVGEGGGHGRLNEGGLMTCLATGACLVWSSYALSEGMPGIGAVPIVTGMSLAVAFLLPRRVRESWGDAPQLISGMSMQLFFATIGATTDVRALFSSGTLLPLFAFIGIILFVQALLLEVVGRRMLRLPAQDILVASNAAVGGPATAAAMVSALRWTSRASPAVLCGSVGYAIGTYAGMLVGWICQNLR